MWLVVRLLSFYKLVGLGNCSNRVSSLDSCRQKLGAVQRFDSNSGFGILIGKVVICGFRRSAADGVRGKRYAEAS